MTLRLVPMTGREPERVAHLVPLPEQESFVGSAAESLRLAPPDRDFHLGLDGEDVVAFFTIDPGFSARIPRLPDGAHGLRGLIVDPARQGRGYGRALMEALPAYLAARYPGLDSIWLSVDLGNAAARRLYARTGWRLDGPEIPGREGPEAVLRLELPTGSTDRG